MTGHPLLHGIWTPLNDIIEIAREYDGMTGKRIDTMLRIARDQELIEGFQWESPGCPLLAPVVVTNRESVPSTFLYGRKLAMDEWGDEYMESQEVYAGGVDDRCALIVGARPFVPYELALRIVDFGANRNLHEGIVLARVQKEQASVLAVFEAIFAASQHPEWVRQMDCEKVPHVLMAALIFEGYSSPYIRRLAKETQLLDMNSLEWFRYRGTWVLNMDIFEWVRASKTWLFNTNSLEWVQCGLTCLFDMAIFEVVRYGSAPVIREYKR